MALMDADDISLPHRFELQMKYMSENPETDVLGTQISEFVGDPSNVVSERIVPTADSEIKEFMKRRCPMNQMSVVFRRSSYDSAGGYMDWFCNEDYYLWIRMFGNGCRFANLPQVLVNVRVGKAMVARRGGWKYFLSEERIQRYMLKAGVVSRMRYLSNVLLRFVGQVLMPTPIRVKLFKFARKRPKTAGGSALIEEKVVSSSPFSVAMCVYGGDDPEWFDAALGSVVGQTLKPSEIVLVVDGEVPDSMKRVIEKYVEKCKE